MMTYRQRVWLLIGLTVFMVIGFMTFLPSVPQNLAYHNFADQRSILGLQNFFDVTSNLAFLNVGVAGLFNLWKHQNSQLNFEFINDAQQVPYWLLFIGVLLASFGSAYYHLEPNNARLVWDRLPMTLIFMSFFSSIIIERINLKAGLILLFPLVCLGIFSVLYWHWSELKGGGDLRLYILVQFYPMLAIPLILLLFPSRYTRSRDLFFVFFFYGLAKLFELHDSEFYETTRVVSGHTLKHLAAAIAAYWILRMLQQRRMKVT